MGNSDSKVLESEEVVVIDEATLREQESATAMGSSIGGSSDRLPPVPAASSSSSSGLHQRRQPSGRGNRSTQEQDDVVRAGPASSTSCVSDDRVDVNIAMSDLMAYLQVVANNSSGLPITRRDNPSMPSSTLPMDELNPDDYQRKSAAFVPADVRVIGATYTGYRTIWDLPRTQVRAGAYIRPKSYSCLILPSLVPISISLVFRCRRKHTRTWTIVWWRVFKCTLKSPLRCSKR